MAETSEILTAILTTVGLSVFYMAMGYVNKAQGEDFDAKKLLRTLLIGIFVGFYLWGSDLSVTTATIGVATAWVGTAYGGFLVVLVDKMAAWIWKRLDEPVEPQVI